MAEFIQSVQTEATYVDALTLGPASGVTQVSFSLLASEADDTTVYPALVQYAVYPTVNGLFNTAAPPVWEPYERQFAGGSQGVIIPNLGGIRFRSVPGQAGPATVYAEMDFAGDPLAQGGAVTGAIISSSGSSSGGGGGVTNVYNYNPSNPAGTTSATGVMMGLAGNFAPATARMLVVVSGYVSNVASAVVQLQLRYGTGTAPSNGNAPSGTAVGSLEHATASASNYSMPFEVSAIITGLVASTTYWLDLVLLTSGGTATVANLNILAHDL